MKINVRNGQGEIVRLEVTPPIQNSYGVWSFVFLFPDSEFRTVTMDRYELRALLSTLVGSL